MVSILPPRTRSGWRPWKNVPTSVAISGPAGSERFSMSFGVVSKEVLPSSMFQIWSPTSNCTLQVPWSQDAFDPFGGGGSITGITGAITAINGLEIHNSQKSAVSYSLISSDGYGPIVGYCLGNIFSERAYFNVTAVKDEITGGVLLTAAYQDVLQRYKISRFILHHGIIETYYKSNDPNSTDEFLSLGINKLPSTLSKKGVTMTVYKKSGNSVRTISVAIKGFLENGDAIVNPFSASADVPASGDFYIIDTPYFIDDPFLAAGIWIGTESDTTKATEDTLSGFELPNTTNQRFYTRAKVMGGYALLNKETGKPVAAGAGQPMSNSTTEQWGWWLKDTNDIDSDGYLNTPNRPSIEYKLDEDAAAAAAAQVGPPDPNNPWTPIDPSKYIPVASVRPSCTRSDVTYGVDTEQTDHVRIELNRCGSIYRNNFHSPILQSEFIIQGGNYFKILAQLDSATIDVSYTAINSNSKLNLDGDMFVLSQYAWKIIEHYSYDAKVPYGKGTVESSVSTTVDGKSITTAKIKMADSTMSPGTKMPVNGSQKTDSNDSRITLPKFDYLDPNSFHKRFTTTYVNPKTSVKDMYEKGFGWVISKDSGKSNFSVNSLASVTETTEDAKKFYVFTLNLDGNIVGLEKGDGVNLFFSNPFKKDGPFDGSSDIVDDGSFETICLLGKLVSPYVVAPLPGNVVLGICDSWYWGLRSISSTGYGTMFFISTPEGFLSLSSYYSSVPYSEGVLYSDYSSKKVNLRVGSVDFTEYPEKMEIAMGAFAKEAIFSSSPVALDPNEERVNSINIRIGKATDEKNGFATFAFGEKSNYYGSEVSGNGKFNLIATTEANMDIAPTDVKNGDAIVSPVYLYKNGYNCVYSQKMLSMGGSTVLGKLHVNNSIDMPGDVTIEYGKIYYVNDNQTIEAFGGADIFDMPDGERIILFNKRINYKLTIDGIANNDTDNKSDWQFSSTAIMATGMHGWLWGTPIAKDTENTSGAYTIPIMIANCCELLCSAYDKVSNSFFLFAKCYNDDGFPFIGFFRINAYDLFLKKEETTSNNKLLFGKPKGSTATETSIKPSNYKELDMPFWFRQIKIGTAYNDKNKTYTALHNLPKTSSFNDMADDTFSRVYGLEETKSVVKGENTGVLSCKITQEGYIILFIDTLEGLSFLFSANGGDYWYKSKVILAKDGVNGFMIDEERVYYVVSGVGVYEKEITSTDLSEIISYTILEAAETGSQTKNIEQLQERINDAVTVSIGTGTLTPQKFSGHVTGDGTRKVFFYDQNGYLSCIQSKRHNFWEIADNF